MKRVNYYDQLKIFSVIAVILFHTSVEYYNFNAHGWVSAIAYSSFTRFCVPIFFMISGATLIEKSDSIGEFFKKRYSKIIPPLVFWSLIYSFVLSKINGSDFNIMKSLGEMITTPVYIHFWFIYAIAGLYLLIPLLMQIREEQKLTICKYYTCIWILFASILPYARAIGISIPEYIGTPYMFNEMYQFLNYSGYLTLGFVLARTDLPIKNAIIKYSISSFALSMILFSLVIHDSLSKEKISQDLWGFKTPVVIALSTLVFLLFKSTSNLAFEKFKPTSSKLVNFVFSVYLVHYLYIFLIVRYFGYVFYPLPVILKIPIETSAITIMSFLTIFIMSKIPLVNRCI
ncbi:acyltransferase [Serratia proteamaculans]|uniref:Acyltransferase family protein n=1 Tax=Serratia proteamaculans TaxID=28151 RepID=A0A5Q2V7U7_SERPR|nr:acyltransferase family protein [Serratia proteamaculans]QGH60160.1 acyltransferase family protein [Serratia proteamaculans]